MRRTIRTLLAQLRVAQRHALAASAVLRRLASTKPHDHEWERSYRAIQEQARHVLTMIGSEEAQAWRQLDCPETTA